MNKSDLIAAVAERAGLSKKAADAAVAAVFGIITEELKRGEKVQIVGFGTFSVREHAEKQGRNPRTGETITVPPGRSPAFKAGKTFKAAIAK